MQLSPAELCGTDWWVSQEITGTQCLPWVSRAFPLMLSLGTLLEASGREPERLCKKVGTPGKGQTPEPTAGQWGEIQGLCIPMPAA